MERHDSNSTSGDFTGLRDNKRVVEVYGYVDVSVRMAHARMYERRLKGDGDMGY